MASNDPEVKIIEISRVCPFINSPQSPTFFSIPLTFFDALWLKFPPVESLFFYQLTDSTRLNFNSEILPKLKHSLSLTLLHYHPLAGKLTWHPHADVPIISYSPNDAVSLLVAESNLDFNRLSGDDIRESPESRHLIPELLSSDESASTMALQITLFPNQGFCIGMSMHHAVVDGVAAIAFKKAWAYLCRQLGNQHPSLLPELTPFSDRTVVKDPTGLCKKCLKNWLDFKVSDDSELNQRSLKILEDLVVIQNSVRATFKLSGEDIKKLKEKILFKLQQKKPTKHFHLSTFVVTYAYILVCLVKSKSVEGNKKFSLLFLVDYRNRLVPPLPANYFGNCVLTRFATLEASIFMDEDGVAIISEKISNMIREIDEKGIHEAVEENLESWGNMEGEEIFSIAGSNRTKFYEIDYGWGKPKKIEIISIDRTGAISMTESGDGNGVEIGTVLSRNEMEIFKSVFVSGLQDA
ncbi:malonyl-CoA:anthocyanidin 5-O-glucoside-6''-O-malonyltransferase-like [Mangifera indica]|uniref:malonyl-CoA:anthocyanidin 5-O-glucoside-6''-O-malonyltransferase-like n=1 Tax=Mangifera indica TaxID=29780 RepID=UPI001CFB7E15|nr:malonyl-CoA:anthocyanidin 5-O-glucoside-6''-O-malonyltransferase-like [Mangifera indica]